MSLRKYQFGATFSDINGTHKNPTSDQQKSPESEEETAGLTDLHFITVELIGYYDLPLTAQICGMSDVGN